MTRITVFHYNNRAKLAIQIAFGRLWLYIGILGTEIKSRGIGSSTIQMKSTDVGGLSNGHLKLAHNIVATHLADS